jgi:hypothetical protein
MQFKYTEREIQARVTQLQLPIPAKIQIQDQAYDVIDLFRQVTKSQSIWLLDPKLNRSNPGPGGRPSKYDSTAWAWMRQVEPEEIARHYKIGMPYARQLKKASLKCQIAQKT